MNMPLYQFLRKNLFTVHSATVLFFLLVAIDAYVCLTPPLHRENGTGKQAEVYRYASSASPRMELTGLDYDLNLKGETRVKLKADRFVIRKKKFGFLRFAMAQEVFLDNVEVCFYQESTLDASGDRVAHSIEDTPFSPFASYAKNIVGLTMAPVSFFFYDKSKNVSRVTAQSGSLQFMEKGIVLKGDVRVQSGEKKLKTSRMTLIPETEQIRIPASFVLEEQGVAKEWGAGVTDVFLKTLAI